jgi:hypothetical protein
MLQSTITTKGGCDKKDFQASGKIIFAHKLEGENDKKHKKQLTTKTST